MFSAMRQLGALRPAGVRFMSAHSPEHAIAETEKWKKISYVFIPVVCATFVFVFATHKHHHWEQVEYSYIKMRNKEMPWALRGGSKCDLFDYECSQKEKAAKAGL